MSQDYPFRGSEKGYGQRDDDYYEDTGTPRQPPGGRGDAAAAEHVRPEVRSLLESCGLDPGDLSALADLPEDMINMDTLPQLLKKLWESKKSKKSESPASGSSHFAGRSGGDDGVGSRPAYERVRLGSPPTTRSDRSAYDRPTSATRAHDGPPRGSNDPRRRNTRTDRDIDLRPGKYDRPTPGTSTCARSTSDHQGRDNLTDRDINQRSGTRAAPHSQPATRSGRSTRDAYGDIDLRPGSRDRSTPPNSLYDPHGRDNRAHRDIDQRRGMYDRPTSETRSYDRRSHAHSMYDRPTSATKSHNRHGRDTLTDPDIDRRPDSYDRPTAGTRKNDRPTPANGSFDPHDREKRTYRDIDLRPGSHDRTTSGTSTNNRPTPANGMYDRSSPVTSTSSHDPHDRETSTDRDISQRQGTYDRTPSATGKNDRYHWTRDAGQQRKQSTDDDDPGGSLVTCVSKEESTPHHMMTSKKNAAPHSQPKSRDRYRWTREGFQPRKQLTDDYNDNQGSLVTSVTKEESTSHHTMPSKKEASDFHGRHPDGLPYTCSLCNHIVVINWDWIQHINSAQHADNRLDLLQRYPAWDCQINSYRPDEEHPFKSWQKPRTLIALKRSSEPTEEAPSNKRPNLEKTPEKTEENLLGPEAICEPTTKTFVNLQVNDEALEVESGAPANSTSAPPCEKKKDTEDEDTTGKITSVPEQDKDAGEEQPDQQPFVLVKSKKADGRKTQRQNRKQVVQWLAKRLAPNAEAMGIEHDQKEEAEAKLLKSPVPMQEESLEGAGPHLADEKWICPSGSVAITRFYTYHPGKGHKKIMPLVIKKGFLWSTIYWAEWRADDKLDVNRMVSTGRNNLHLSPGDRESRQGRSILKIDLQASSRPGLRRWSRPHIVPVNVKIWYDRTYKIPWAEVIDANNPDIWRILFLPASKEKSKALLDHLEK
ncbi:uncharacterized protein LOC134439945 [Engraulis encrasicolus]|uniref:uncharacterized protein LOC134439945 n=1 Tax=Engraulis encrasicolus TaxID=184585 RepID=UPI002FCE6A34